MKIDVGAHHCVVVRRGTGKDRCARGVERLTCPRQVGGSDVEAAFAAASDSKTRRTA